MVKIFLGTPAYSGKVNAQFAISLAETYCDLARNNIECDIRLNCSGSLLCAERNRLVDTFLKSDCTHMLCVDSDLGWPFQCVRGLLSHDLDFVGGVYPTRRENAFLFRPIFNDDKSIRKTEKGLLEMESIPAGFMLLKRQMLEKMVRHFPHLYFSPKDPTKPSGYALFNTEVINEEFWGEDYVFCLRARQAGFQIWVDPCIEFDHDGVRGMLLQALTEDKSKAL